MAESKFLDRYHLKTNDIDVKICEDHLNEIAGICFDDWNDLYPFLGMDTKDIALIEAEPIPKTKAKSFFRLWKKRNGSNATYRRLIDALIKIKSIDGAESVCEILMSQNESVLESGTKSSGVTPFVPQKGYHSPSPHYQSSHKDQLQHIRDGDTVPVTKIYNPSHSVDREDLIRRQLLHDNHAIMNHFVIFKCSLAKAIEKEKISLEELILYLCDVSVYYFNKREQISQGYLPHDVRLKLDEAKSIWQIFAILKDVSSYINYGIFQSIIQHFFKNSPATIEAFKLSLYDEQFKNFIKKHTVQEFLKINPQLEEYCTEDSSKLIIKLDVEHTEKLATIVNIKDCISIILGLPVLRIIDIKQGCVKVTVFLPTSVTRAIFHRATNFTADQIERLKYQSVMWLQCNGFTFDARNNYLPVATVTSLPEQVKEFEVVKSKATLIPSRFEAKESYDESDEERCAHSSKLQQLSTIRSQKPFELQPEVTHQLQLPEPKLNQAKLNQAKLNQVKGVEMWSSPNFILALVTTVFIITIFIVAQTALDQDYSDCASDLGTLESALYRTDPNLYELNRVFFPPSLLQSRFIRVNYTFFNDQNDNDDCNVTYIWAVGGVLFLQPPTLFKYISLYFYFPFNNLTTLSLHLPIECIPLINGTDGMCSCMHDSHMLDVLTQQLNIYAKFTSQENIERSNTFARAICAGELYDKYYCASGMKSEFTYIIIASAIVGPLLLIVYVLTDICFLTKKYIPLCKCKTSQNLYDEEQNKINTKTRKNLVVFVLITGILYVSLLILDTIFVVHTVITSSHEYEEELSTRNLTLNLGASIGTLICDTFAILWTIVILTIIIVTTISTSLRTKIKKYNVMENSTIEKHSYISSILFPSLLLSPFICVTSHLGYIVLAWVTEPSRSTTTLILYYFILFYLFIIIRMSYKYGMKLLAKCMPKEEAKSEKVYHSVVIFFLNLGLGIIYLSLAVPFIVFVYLKPLASEDLFNYLVIQFMIVVVSTQYFYKLFTGNNFSIKGVIKNVHKKISDKYPEMYESMEDHHLDNKKGRLVTDLIATKLDHVYNNTRSKTSPLHSRDSNIDTPPVDSSTPSGVVSIPMQENKSHLFFV